MKKLLLCLIPLSIFAANDEVERAKEKIPSFYVLGMLVNTKNKVASLVPNTIAFYRPTGDQQDNAIKMKLGANAYLLEEQIIEVTSTYNDKEITLEWPQGDWTLKLKAKRNETGDGELECVNKEFEQQFKGADADVLYNEWPMIVDID